VRREPGEREPPRPRAKRRLGLGGSARARGARRGSARAPTLTGPTKITTAAFSPAWGGGTCIAQPSTTQPLDSLADRLMYRLAYRDFGSYESLVVNHSVTVGSTASGVRWYEVRSPGGTPALFQSGAFSPDATARWMGSIAQNQQGNMLRSTTRCPEQTTP